MRDGAASFSAKAAAGATFDRAARPAREARPLEDRPDSRERELSAIDGAVGRKSPRTASRGRETRSILARVAARGREMGRTRDRAGSGERETGSIASRAASRGRETGSIASRAASRGREVATMQYARTGVALPLWSSAFTSSASPSPVRLPPLPRPWGTWWRRRRVGGGRGVRAQAARPRREGF